MNRTKSLKDYSRLPYRRAALALVYPSMQYAIIPIDVRSNYVVVVLLTVVLLKQTSASSSLAASLTQ